jgi:hypothetical protein
VTGPLDWSASWTGVGHLRARVTAAWHVWRLSGVALRHGGSFELTVRLNPPRNKPE